LDDRYHRSSGIVYARSSASRSSAEGPGQGRRRPWSVRRPPSFGSQGELSPAAAAWLLLAIGDLVGRARWARRHRCRHGDLDRAAPPSRQQEWPPGRRPLHAPRLASVGQIGGQ